MSADPEGQARTGRRGPSKETTDAVLTAAFRILVTEGMAAITPTRLHAETGVARTTIYRHWRSPVDFVVDIVAGATRRHDLDGRTYTGDLRVDLETAVETITFRLANRPVRALLGALMSSDGTTQPNDDADGAGTDGAGTDGDDEQAATERVEAASLSRDYLMGLFEPVADVVAAGIERGQLRDEPLDILVTELAAPLLIRQTVLGLDVTRRDGAEAVDRFLAQWST